MTQPKLHFPLLAFAALLLVQSCTDKPGPMTEAQRQEMIRMRQDSIRKANNKVPAALFRTKPLHIDRIHTTGLRYVRYDVSAEHSGNTRVLDTLDTSIRKLAYSNAVIFIIGDNSYRDTLEIYKDSVRFNSLRARKLDEHTYTLKGRPIKVAKYHHEYHNKGLEALDNVFVNDSLGLVMKHWASHHGQGLMEINPELGELHEAIKRDTAFLKLEFRSR